MEAALEAGAEDVVAEDDGSFTITGEPNDLEAMQQALEAIEATINNAEVTMVPENSVEVEEKHVKTLMKLMDALDDCDDVQKVHSNFDISEELLSGLDEE